jgi:hypothetical protein
MSICKMEILYSNNKDAFKCVKNLTNFFRDSAVEFDLELREREGRKNYKYVLLFTFRSHYCKGITRIGARLGRGRCFPSDRMRVQGDRVLSRWSFREGDLRKEECPKNVKILWVD